MDLPSGDRLENIFKRQRELMDKYHPIEAKNGLLLSHDVPVDINDKMGQARIKDMFWRFTEGLGEAMSAFYNHQASFHEELSDALHFLVEALILADIKPDDLVDTGHYGEPLDRLEVVYSLNKVMYPGLVGSLDMIVSRYVKTMTCLTMTANLLKNRAWKQSYTDTDIQSFRLGLIQTFYEFTLLCKYAGIMNPQYLYELYFKKSEVNKLRQSSNY